VRPGEAGPDGIRWLTIDFIAAPGRKYFLEFGPDVRAPTLASPLAVEEGEMVRVRTGALRVEFGKTGPAALGDICADLDGDSAVGAEEKVASGARDGEHYYLDQAGRRFSSAGDQKDRQIVVESRGPVRATVRVDGFYTGADNQRIVKYRTRYHFFAGLGLMKVVDEFGIIGSTQGTRFRTSALRWT